jgi:hypothetical protein
MYYKDKLKEKLPAAHAEQDDLGGWHIWASPGRPHDIGYNELFQTLAWADAWENLHRTGKYQHPRELERRG